VKYTFVKPDGSLGDSREFDSPAPVLNPSKGRWLPDTVPNYDPTTQTAARALVVALTDYVIPYNILAKDPAVVITDAKRLQESVDKIALKTLPVIKQFRKLNKSEVIDAVQIAFPAGAQRDLIKVLALIA
jgi:hypothetical protein